MEGASVEEKSTTIETKKPLTRFGEFELLKAMAIIGLPAIHVMEEVLEGGFGSPGLQAIGDAVIGLCVFGPSVFMICMGFGIGGNQSSPDSIRRTGIQFLLIGALLNIFRWFLPGVVQSIVLHTPLIEDFDYCLQSDIYYFAGLFFITHSFFKKRKITTPGLILFSMLGLSLNTLLTPLTHQYVTNEIAASLLGNFVYVNKDSCFPLLSWSIFPSTGILLGEVLKKSDEAVRERFMKRLLDFSVVLFISFIVFLRDRNIDIMKTLVSPANDYITDLPNVILLISLALALISLAYYLCKRIGASPFMAFMLRISAFIIPFYLLQWVLVSWIVYSLAIFRRPEGCFGIGAYVFTVALITAVCIFVSYRYGMKIMKTLLKITTVKKKPRKAVKSSKQD